MTDIRQTAVRSFSRPVLSVKRTGHQIKFLMERCGLTVRDVQSVFGFSYPQAIYAWVQGKSIPSVDNLLVLAKLFGVMIDDIVQYDFVETEIEVA